MTQKPEEETATPGPAEEEDIPEQSDKCEIVIDEEEEKPGEEEDGEQITDAADMVFTEHTDATYCVAFRQQPLPDGCAVFASGGGDDTAFLYHVNDGVDPKTIKLTGHTDSINAISFSPDGSILATGGLDGVVLTWDPATGEKIAALTGPTDSIEWLGWHPSLPAVLAGDRAGLTWLWNARTGKCAKVYSNHQGPVTAGGFRPNGAEIWTAGEDMILRVWSPKTGQPTLSVKGVMFHQEPITTGSTSPNGAVIATGDMSGIVKLTKFDDGRGLGQLDAGENSIEGVMFSPDGRWIAVASMGGAATVWNPNDLKMRCALTHPAGVTCMRWHPKQPLLVTGCVDGAVRVWDVRNGEMLCQLPGHEDVITSVAVKLVEGSDTDLLIVTSSDDSSVRLWSYVESEVKPPKEPEGEVPL